MKWRERLIMYSFVIIVVLATTVVADFFDVKYGWGRSVYAGVIGFFAGAYWDQRQRLKGIRDAMRDIRTTLR